jgi:hypothetical protein
MCRFLRAMLVTALVCGSWVSENYSVMDVGSKDEAIQFPAYGPLWAIGHRNIHKNQVLVANRFVDIHEDDGSFDVSIMSLRYGITDHVTAFAYLPVVYNNQEDNRSDSGLGNFSVNTEYMFFEKEVGAHRSEATILAEIGFPTATTVSSNLPLLDTKSYRFLLGTTGEYGTMYSYFYYSLGAVMYTKHEGRRPGNEFLYEWGFAPVFYHNKDHDLFLFIDWNGHYVSAGMQDGSSTQGGIDEVSAGGNILYMGSALEYWYKNLLAYISFQAPVTQSFADITHYRTSFYINVIF